jgi:hypothetical protein
VRTSTLTPCPKTNMIFPFSETRFSTVVTAVNFHTQSTPISGEHTSIYTYVL